MTQSAASGIHRAVCLHAMNLLRTVLITGVSAGTGVFSACAVADDAKQSRPAAETTVASAPDAAAKSTAGDEVAQEKPLVLGECGDERPRPGSSGAFAQNLRRNGIERGDLVDVAQTHEQVAGPEARIASPEIGEWQDLHRVQVVVVVLVVRRPRPFPGNPPFCIER